MIANLTIIELGIVLDSNTPMRGVLEPTWVGKIPPLRGFTKLRDGNKD